MASRKLTRWLSGCYYGLKLFPFRMERRERLAGGRQQGLVGIQIDGLAFPYLQQALDRGYLPHLERYLRRGNKLIEYHAGLPSTTPAAQAAFFYGDDHAIPAFRWFEKATGQIISCNDPDHVQIFREKLFAGERGLLAGGASYSNILDGDAERSIFTVSSPHPQTLFGRLGGLRILLLLLVNPLRTCRMFFASFVEYWANRKDEWHHRRKKGWRTQEGLFPFIRIFCNVILREMQTFGVIAEIYAGTPRIYSTYSGYDEIAHHFGPGSWPALRNLIYIDRRIGEIIRAIDYAAGNDYLLVILSDHGQTPGYPFQNRFGATLGDAVSAFLRENQTASVSSGSLEVARAQIGYLQDELDARHRSLRYRIYRQTKDYLQRKIHSLVPETLKIDPQGGVVITYSSSLAHLYITGAKSPLNWKEVEEAQPLLLRFLQRHRGIGFVLARGEQAGELMIFHRDGALCVTDDPYFHQNELAFLRPYGIPYDLLRLLHRFGLGPHCGDLVLFGALDEEGLACFDDQVGGHGSVGGEQSRPFIILPLGHPVLEKERLIGYEFLYHEIFRARVGEDSATEQGSSKRGETRSLNQQLFDSEFILHD
ncbi:MAG: alkaline phosphatase family protein [Desulfuromonadales bacterium]